MDSRDRRSRLSIGCIVSAAIVLLLPFSGPAGALLLALGVPLTILILFVRRIWRTIPLERRHIQFHLLELIALPVLLTPGLALFGMAGDLGPDATLARILGGLLFAYAAMGAILGWTSARANPIFKRRPTWSCILDVLLGSLLFTLLSTPFLFVLWAFLGR